MKNLMMLALMVLGTSSMVNAQTEPAKKATKKEMKAKKADKKAETTKMAEPAPAVKK
jgi:Na+-transporting methylmalonyl-CoA/oxaloacetate decarboxylase gamma subunit